MHEHDCSKKIGFSFIDAKGVLFRSMATLRIFLRVFLKKHTLFNLIKREIHMLTTITIKKTQKYRKFTIAIYEFSYFEIVA